MRFLFLSENMKQMKIIKLLTLITFYILLQLGAQAERLVLVGASYGKNILAICTEKGDPIWQYKTAGPQRGHTGHHDVHLLPNGNILFHDTWTSVKEITLDKKLFGNTTVQAATVTREKESMFMHSLDSKTATQ